MKGSWGGRWRAGGGKEEGRWILGQVEGRLRAGGGKVEDFASFFYS